MRRNAGFTLLEMLVALAILGLIAGLVFPDLRRGLATQSLRGGTITGLTALRTARARALATDAPVRLSLAQGGTVLTVSGLAPTALPAPLRARIAPADGILFYGDGSSGGGELEVGAGERTVRFAVSPTTGLVRSVG